MELLVPLVKGGPLLLNVDICRKELVDGSEIPSATTTSGPSSCRAIAKGHLRYEGDINDGGLVADEPLLLREHAVEDAKHALDLVPITLDRGGHLFGVEGYEPAGLAEQRALARRLEVEPLELSVVLIGAGRDGDLAFLVVSVDDVLDYGVRLPITRFQKIELDI